MPYRFDAYDSSIVIDGFQDGIAESPYLGISDIRNVNITSIPGEASVNFATSTVTLPPCGSGSVTSVDATNDTVTVTGSAASSIVAGVAIRFSGLDANGLVTGTQYWVNSVTGTLTFKISANPLLSGTVNITGTGSGTFTTQTMGKPLQRAYNYYSATSYRYFILDDAGQAWGYNDTLSVFQYLGNTTLTNGNGNGLICYQGYLFVFRNNTIDILTINTLGTTVTWIYGWNPATGGSGATPLVTGSSTNNSHYAVQSINDSKVYYCDSNHIGTFYQNQSATTFDPTDTTSYTFTQTILDLPTNDIAQCITELGPNLLIGGQLNAIYPWDRIVRTAGSAGNLSVLSFYSTPILVAENFISRMVTVNTNAYIFAGIKGRIYVTNGSQASFFKKVPDHISGTVEPYFQWGDAGSVKNQLYFGVSATTNAGVAINQYGGVWAIDLDSKALRLAHKLSYGTYAGIASVILPLVITSPTVTPAGTGLYIGYTSASGSFPGGMDVTTTAPYTTSVSTIDSDLIPIGTYNKPRDLTQVEFRLSRPMVSGESITIKTRLIFNTTDTGYTTTLTNSTVGVWSGSNPINFKKAQWVQFQVVLNSTASSPSFVRLREIRIMGVTAA